MPKSSGFKYPHSTIQSTGSKLNGHANTLHSTASSASGTSLSSGSLGSIGSGTANALQGHIGNVPGRISQMAGTEDAHGSRLTQNSHNMQDTDDSHASTFSGIGSRGPLLITNGPGGVIGGRIPVGDQSSLDQLHAGATGPGRTPGLAAGRAGGLTGTDTSFPSAPTQPPPGTTPVPGETHGHTTHGEYKPPAGGGRRPLRPQAVGGHVASGDVDGPFPASTLPPPARPGRPVLHGGGVEVGAAGTVHPPQSNGVYGVQNAPIAGHPGAPGNNKPMSTMFPQGTNSGQVQNVGNQAWNHGSPSGGMNQPNNPANPAAGATTWTGQGQIPYTPTWNPGGADHGSGDGNSPYAGHTVNVQGFHRPMDPTNPGTEHPATYFPSQNQPPAAAPFDYETGPQRTYDDPNVYDE
jgi:hypothetical protein